VILVMRVAGAVNPKAGIPGGGVPKGDVAPAERGSREARAPTC